MYAMKVLDLQLVVVASPEATLYIADYVKVGIGHLSIPNNAMISLNDHQTIAYCMLLNSKCPT